MDKLPGAGYRFKVDAVAPPSFPLCFAPQHHHPCFSTHDKVGKQERSGAQRSSLGDGYVA